MLSRQFIQSVLGLIFLVTSSFVLSNTQFTYNNNGESIEILGCANICPLNLVIPSEIDGLPVTKIGWAAFHNNHLTSVFIPNTVNKIDNQAFGHNNLSGVIIPESVREIGWLAFSDNNLQAVSLPSGLERIEAGVFSYNQITDIVIPDSVNFMGTDAFRGNNINDITLSNSLMLISRDAFTANDITNLTIPNSVISIDDRAFSQNPIENVTFLGDRPEIGIDVFASSTEVRFCNNTDGWPGEPISLATPQQISDCSLNITPTSNPVVNYSVFDLDQNGSFEALTDALLLLRYAFGLRGDNLINGAIATDANRTAAVDIEAHLKSYLP